MHQENISTPHSENTSLRKYGGILLSEAASHSADRECAQSAGCEMNRDNASSFYFCAPRKSLPYPTCGSKFNLSEVSRSPSRSSHHVGLDRLSLTAIRPWRKLRNALLVTTSTLSPGRKDKKIYESNDAFLDYFSTQRRSSLNTYHREHRSFSQMCLSERKTQNHCICFEGFNKFPEPQQTIRNENSSQDKSPFSFYGSPNSCTHVGTTYVEESEAEMKQTKNSGPKMPNALQSGTLAQKGPTQLEEWGGLEDCAPFQTQSSRVSMRGQGINNLWDFNFRLPQRLRFPRSNNSCYANPSDNGNLFEHIRSTHFICNPQGRFMFIWLGIVAMATVYNFWTAILRQAFDEVQRGKRILWICLDAVADLIYLTDIMVQFRTSYLEKGLVVKDTRKIATRYLWSRSFALDSLALLPFDLFQSVTGIQPLLRFPRFLKCFRAWHWKVMVENRTTFPNTWRVLTLTHILFLGCHWFASIYYILSESTQFQNPWGYPAPTTPELQSLLRKYLQSFYWATVTLTTIGDIAEPEATFQ